MTGRRFGLVAMAAAIAGVLAIASAAAQDDAPTALPYEAEMLRLSEIMGALHYLRRLCVSEHDSGWRDAMEALLDAEQPDAVRRARMIDRFNRGYEGYRSVYRACTPAAEAVVERFLDEGARLAADLNARYGETQSE